MPNMTPAKYTKQLGPMVTPETAAEVEAWAAVERVSISRIAGEAIERDLKRRRRLIDTLDDDVQEVWQVAYNAALARTAAQGQKHVTRRRAADGKRAGRA